MDWEEWLNKIARREMLEKVNEQTRDKSEEDKHISLIINGNQYSLEGGHESYQIKQSDTLAHTLRETLGLKGTKVSRDDGTCGSCTVICLAS